MQNSITFEQAWKNHILRQRSWSRKTSQVQTSVSEKTMIDQNVVWKDHARLK